MPLDASENPRIMRIAAWMWLVYLLSLAVVDLFIYGLNTDLPNLLWYHFFNGLPAVIFMALAYIRWKKSDYRFLTPLLILLISMTPILMNRLLDLRLPPAPLANLEGMILRQLPVLFIALVLVAWHYRLLTIILFSVGINLFEWWLVFSLARFDDPRLTAYYFIIVIRMVCFIVVGIFINQLINYLRAQQESLRVANQRLTFYANTLENLTVSRERNRMSRELHDTVVHTLSGLSVQLETIKAYIPVDAETALTLVSQSLNTTRSGLQETRRAIKALRASPLEDLGLVLALRQLIDTAAERGRLRAEVSLPEQEPVLRPEVEQCIYRVTQEAVENVVHHANAQHLKVELSVQEDLISLLVQDDGIGFRPDVQPAAGHYGLAGMQERAQWAGGVLTVTSQPTQGTKILLKIVRGAQ